ncbi:hypothetical protein D3C80_136350 [compost metagenome]
MIEDKYIEGTFLVPKGEKVLDVRNMTELKSLQMFLNGSPIGKTDLPSDAVDRVSRMMNQDEMRGTFEVSKR